MDKDSLHPIIDTPEKAAAEFSFIKDETREHFICMTLDAANRKIAIHVVSIGTLTASLVHPREVFVDAILDRAASIIVGHNHPSGDLTISAKDREVTERLRQAAKIIGITLLDHLIITRAGFTKI